MSNRKTVFAISDLHIGDGGPRDNFGYEGSDRPKQLMAFLDYVEREDGEVVIVGDLLDFWQANFSRVLTNGFNSKLIERLGELKATYVIGNHDIDLVGFVDHKLLSPPLFQRLSGPFNRDINGKTFYFMHGHEVDPYNSGEVPGKGRLLTIFAGMAESFAGSPELAEGCPIETMLAQTGEGAWNAIKVWGRRQLAKLLLLFGVASNELSPAQNSNRATELLVNYKAHKDRHHYDVLIVGHTHQPGRIGNWYFNTGSWATTDNNFLRIDPDGRVEVFDWSHGHPRPNTRIIAEPDDKQAS